MSKDPKQQENLTPEQEVGVIVSKSEKFIDDNKKNITVAVLAVIILVGAFFAYKHLYAQPKEDKAKEAMFRAEHYFGVDSFALALNGDGAKTTGFLEIIKKYGSTEAGNLAQAYAGISYFKLGEYDKALEHLKKFSADDEMLAPTVVGLIGDCLVEKGNVQEAVSYFEKAAAKADNSVISPVYLKKAGLAYESLGQNDKAMTCYKTIKDKYYDSEEAGLIDRYIERLNLK
ncbi:tol-pal system protein YbgF [Porphyromonas cangingivalis]|uniref:tetratricopeptide repeat protein n=1 Tax=Porphyromonas cangingivalis TaxID=36874 RepID=UPI000D9DA72F|nr:tetratricopeptide repeat protein [Porphyromonas cangingivalis]SPY34961.1 tol-pal system protein YbgF [Porphyromonas cangingivalis]